jgi:hypothetical protein
MIHRLTYISLPIGNSIAPMAYIGRRLIIIIMSQADVSSRQKNSLPRPTETGWPMKNSVRPQADMGLTLVKMSRRQNFFGRSLMNEQSPTVCTPKHLCNSPFSCPKTRHKLNEMNSPQIHFSVKHFLSAPLKNQTLQDGAALTCCTERETF